MPIGKNVTSVLQIHTIESDLKMLAKVIPFGNKQTLGTFCSKHIPPLPKKTKKQKKEQF